MDREGLEALSMRKLGAELGVEAMSLYNHVPNKGAMLDGMVEVLFRNLELPPDDDDWEALAREAYQGLRKLAHAHPNVFPIFVERPPDTMDGAWMVETFLASMLKAGFDKKASIYAFRTLTSYTIGYVMSEIRGFAMEPDQERTGALQLPPEDFPAITNLSPQLANIDRDTEFEFGLDLILAGLRMNLSD